MSFLKKDLLEKVKSKTTPVQAHPILQDGMIPLSVRNAYLNGCIFAAMMDDGKVSKVEKSKLFVIARSLQLSESDLEDGINSVSSCGEADRVGLLSEIIAQVKGGQCSFWFVIDFERMMAVSENISEDGKEVLSFICEKLFARDDWRLAAWQLEKVNCTLEEFNRYFWAAEDGDCYAQWIVGHCYQEGEMIDKDPRRGLKWLEKAAMQGYGAAQLDVARCYKTGLGAKADVDKAEAWYRKAAAGDCLDAQKELEQFLSDRQIELHNQEVRRKEAERMRQKQAEERKKKKIAELQSKLNETKDAYLTTANKVGWVVSAIIVILIWNWLSFWKFVLFGWIIICVAIPVAFGIAKSVAESAYDSLRQKKEAEIENS